MWANVVCRTCQKLRQDFWWRPGPFHSHHSHWCLSVGNENMVPFWEKGVPLSPPTWGADQRHFFEALAVHCAVHLAVTLRHATYLCIVTDNTNTFDTFRSLCVLSDYNPILMSAINILLKHKINLHVVYIPGVQMSLWMLCQQQIHHQTGVWPLHSHLSTPLRRVGGSQKWFASLQCPGSPLGPLGPSSSSIKNSLFCLGYWLKGAWPSLVGNGTGFQNPCGLWVWVRVEILLPVSFKTSLCSSKTVKSILTALGGT